MSIRILTLLMVAAASLGLCQTGVRPEIVRTVQPRRERDPRLEAAIQKALDEARFSYSYDRVTLHGRVAQEVLVSLHGSEYCGSGGCTLLVFTSQAGEYRLVSRVSMTHPPVIVSSHQTNGWRDLILFVAGGGVQPGYYAVLRFDGKRYPENPTTEPAARLRERARGVAYLPGADDAKYDIVVSPR